MKIASKFISQDVNFTKDLRNSDLLESFKDKALDNVKKNYGNFPISKILFSTEVAKSNIKMDDFTIIINPDYLTELGGYLPTMHAVEGLIELEAAAYLFHPYDIKRELLQRSVILKEKQGREYLFYYNLVNKFLRIFLSNGENTKVCELLSSIPPVSSVDIGCRVYLEEVTGKQILVDELVDDKIWEFVDNIKSIDFLNLENGIPQFVKKDDIQNIEDLKDFIFYAGELTKNKKEDGIGEDFGDLLADSENLGSAITELLREGLITEKEFKKLLEEQDIKVIVTEHELAAGNNFNEDDELLINRFVYKNLLNDHRVYTQKVPLLDKKGIFPSHLEKFEPGDDISNLDFFNSFGGKILPGLSNKWIKKPVHYHGTFEELPKLVLMLDDSSSMPNPIETISNAVLGAISVSFEYIENRSKVMTVKFSDRTEVFDFCNDIDRITDFLMLHKNGYDTRIDLDVLESKLSEKEIYDIVIITDGEIANKLELTDFFNKHISSRVFYFRIVKTSFNVKKEVDTPQNMKIFNITDASDIGKIVIGER
ncbi:MAG: hypothetical protein JXR48_11340 [Candidatus Delongbacteria bacterium]|nr:hypothetical protein [Candidatus Delongbacteria bacterium]MBN2835547.1 hypothetical protein [Candidatus Delongbacteria bacterium]